MKTINVSFNDSEFKKVKRVKDLSDASSWREWILLLVKKSAQENKPVKCDWCEIGVATNDLRTEDGDKLCVQCYDEMRYKAI